MKIVISQPFFLPWVGLFEQLRLADVFVHYDDVQMPGKGNFVNRVQIKTAAGTKWLTVPIKHIKGVAQKINEVEMRNDLNWREEHLAQIRENYRDAPHFQDLKPLLATIYETPFDKLSDFGIFCIETISKYFHFDTRFYKSSELGIDGKSSQRVVDIVKHFQGDQYISGLGAQNYIDYDLFENAGISFHYINYRKKPYPQLFGEFTPYVSVIDLIANCGWNGREYICSDTLYWKEFVQP